MYKKEDEKHQHQVVAYHEGKNFCIVRSDRTIIFLLKHVVVFQHVDGFVDFLCRQEVRCRFLQVSVFL